MFQKDKRISRGYMEGNHLIYCRIYKTIERSYFNICTKRIVNNVLSKCKKKKEKVFRYGYVAYASQDKILMQH